MEVHMDRVVAIIAAAITALWVIFWIIAHFFDPSFQHPADVLEKIALAIVGASVAYALFFRTA
jgi:hypothetical protein